MHILSVDSLSALSNPILHYNWTLCQLDDEDDIYAHVNRFFVC